MIRRFRKLCRQHTDRIYTFAFYYLGNREDAEDVTQEVLLRLWNHWERIESDSLPAWITRVTRNLCLDSLRKRRSYRALVSADPDGDLQTMSAHPGSNPESDLQASEIRKQVQRALDLLDEPYRSIIILREIQDMKYEQISDALNLPLNTVKAYLHRGRERLRNQIRGEDTK